MNQTQQNDKQKLVVRDIVLRDLQPLLRGTICNSLIVNSFTTKALVSMGENYGSTILDVHVIIQKDENAEKEDLYLVAKMCPPTDFQKRIFDSAYTFKKEMRMYTELMPAYNKLEIECGYKPDDVFNILPRFYGYRGSLDPKTEFDDDAVILLENLKSHGYYTGDRQHGCDYEHMKFATLAMARFHALGIATKCLKPDYFKQFVAYSKMLNMNGNDFGHVHKAILKKVKGTPEINLHYDRCEKALEYLAHTDIWSATPEEPWSTIIHADFWVNNILFHREALSNHVDDIKFVDFQNYLFLSPLRELVFFLFSSANASVLENQVDDLIDLYHRTLVEFIERMGCDASPYDRESFDARLPKDAYIEFMHLSYMLKVLTLDNTQLKFNMDEINTIIVDYEGNQHFVDRLRDLILYFVKRNWI